MVVSRPVCGLRASSRVVSRPVSGPWSRRCLCLCPPGGVPAGPSSRRKLSLCAGARACNGARVMQHGCALIIHGSIVINTHSFPPRSPPEGWQCEYKVRSAKEVRRAHPTCERTCARIPFELPAPPSSCDQPGWQRGLRPGVGRVESTLCRRDRLRDHAAFTDPHRNASSVGPAPASDAPGRRCLRTGVPRAQLSLFRWSRRAVYGRPI